MAQPSLHTMTKVIPPMKNKSKKTKNKDKVDSLKHDRVIEAVLASGGTILYLDKDEDEDVITIHTFRNE